ncbi:hypothetical protein FZC78_11310 [Rossellomorea vietnamensis]|uniref:Uncharacterized protein n=1 Tax=Rossellomorea vietnamensis TaxID=218284 RepID=A0A5D4NTC3_9BACI|nr:hypothetical protein [Rossellomorea vietnamensis]TYS16576.1 hypothetical protein FZC78_11310 [Rossellomorea vietnamensis]
MAGVNENIQTKRAKLVALGNGIEVAGNSLQAIGREALFTMKESKLPIIGAWLQSVGNSTNLAAVLLLLSEEEKKSLIWTS